MPTSPLTGSRYPDATYTPAIWTWIEQAVRDIEDNTLPNYASTGARDAAYTAWVAAGNAMRDGLHCTVGATRYVYLSGSWTVDPVGYTVKAMRAQRNSAASIPSGSYEAFTSNTGWTETDPWNLRGSGALVQTGSAGTGLYQINVTVRFTNDGTGRRGIRLNPSAGQDIGAGSGNPLYLDERMAVSGGFATTLSASHLTSLTSGATVQLEALQTSGSALDVTEIHISAAYLGPNT